MKSNEAMEESVFTVGTQVWVDHPSEGFQAGVIISTEEIAGGVKIMAGTEYTILGDDDKQERKCRAEELQLRNPSILEGCDDMTALSYMNEPSILHNLHMRFSIHQIYTYTGPILIAINPYQRLPIYGKQMIAQYCGQPLGKLAPHVYAIADNAFRSMRDDNMSQSILVSGESGAGKTETTKVLLQFFAAMGQNKGEGNVHKQVLESTPLLEAFGNAKTLRNNNSSRFGKFIQIEFDKAGNMCGAAVQTYLLEKSRIVRQQPGERNYHVFYQLIAGLPPDKKRELHLTSAEDYSYTNHSGCIQVEDIEDKDRFQDTIKALEIVGISKAQQSAIFTILAAVLHIGNVRFENAGGSDAGLKLVDENPLRLACELLGCNLDGMRHVLTERKVSAANETYTVPMSLEQADGARDALSMLLYSRMFDWMVTALNDNIANTSKQQRQKAKAEKGGLIGVLDIYGFECFDNNSFEQFCINYANEKLQQQFNAHIFKLEQQEYVREELKWAYIDFDDNQPCLDLIEQKPLGILSLLDEECRLAKATPETFVDKLTKNHKQCKFFSLPRFSRSSFTVEHYAGKVTYDTAAFMDKNKDYIIEAQVALMKQSNNDFVKGIFLAARKAALELEKQELAKKGPPSVFSPARRSASAVKFVSVASQFKESLAALMGSISSTNPHYIRCIKPNPDKRAMDFDKLLVLHQLRCGGVLSSIKISVAGYPNRRTYEEFRLRYQMLGKCIPAAEREHRQVCHGLIKEMHLEEGKYQFGKTKLYLRAGQIGLLEKRRTEKLNKVAVIVQKNWRRYLVQKEYVRLRRALLRIQAYLKMGIAKNMLQSLRRERASVVIQRNGRCWLARQAFLSERISSIVLQKMIRMWQARWSYKRELAIIQLQSCWRGVIARRTAETLRREGAALLIQKRMRSFHYRQYWKKLCIAVVIGQSVWRGKQSRKLYSEMREEARNLNNIVAAKMKEVEGLEYRLQAEVKQKIRLLKEKERMAEALERMQEEMTRKEEIQLAAAKKEAQMEALRRELQELKEKQDQKDQERKLKEQHALELRARQKREEEERIKQEKEMETQRALELANQLHQEELRTLGEENKEWQTKYRLLLAQKEEAEASLHAEVEQWRAKYDQLNAELQRERAEAQQERNKWSSEAMETLATRRMKLAPPLNAEASEEQDLANQPPPFVELPSHNVDIDLVDSIRSNIAAFDKSYQATKHIPATAVATAAAQSAPSPPYIIASREPDVSPRSPYAAPVVQVARDTTTAPKFVLSNNAEQKQPANQSLLSLLPKASDEASLQLLHFLIFELEPGFCEGVPVPALALYSFLLHWGSFPVSSNEGNLLTFITNSLRKVVAGSLSDNTLLTYWLSNMATLLHLVHKKINHRGGADASADHEEEETFAVYDMESVDDETELFQVSSVSSEANSPMLSSSGYDHADSNNSESPKSLRIRAMADSFQEGHMLLDNRLAKELSKLNIPEREKRHSATFFHEQLKDLVAKIYAVLMKRLCVRLELLVKDAVLTPVVTDHGKSQGGATVSRVVACSNTNNRKVNIESVRMVLQDYLVGFIENFVHPGLVQRFYRQAFRFINAHIFNELLLNRRVCSMENGVHIKMQVASLEQWLHERGGVWCLGAEEELEPTRQVLRVLFVDKHSLIASREQRQEVCPTLNTMQLKQLLMSYTPGYLEPPINLRLLSKLGLQEEETQRLKEGEEGVGENHGHQEFLLLESSPTGWPLRFSELHFLELADALQVAFPTELKTHIHSLNAETTLAKMERANQQLRAAQDLNNKARHHHSSSSSSSPSSSTDASPTPRPRKALFGSLFHSGVKKK